MHTLKYLINPSIMLDTAVGTVGIMETFFKNADTAYILAYAVIMLNTDAHNPMVVTKMTKADFVRINTSTGAEEHAPKVCS